MRVFLATVATLLAALVVASPALSWAWPIEGSIARPFVVGDSPYAAGQHRGVDINAAVGETVHAPSAGTVTFAGTVPRGGGTVTILTDDGYKATLQQLTGLLVRQGDAVSEGDPIGQVAESRDPAATYSHVHLGVRDAELKHGYVDPLSLLPPAGSDQPSSGGGDVPVSTDVPDPEASPPPDAEPAAAEEAVEPVEPAAELEEPVGAVGEGVSEPVPAEEAVAEPVAAEEAVEPVEPAAAEQAVEPVEPAAELEEPVDAVGEGVSEASSDAVTATQPADGISVDTSAPSSDERERETEPTSTVQQGVGREVTGGRAERSAVSGALDPVETATTASRGGATVEVPGVRAGESPESPPAAPPQSVVMEELGGIAAQGREPGSEGQRPEQRDASSLRAAAPTDAPLRAAQGSRSEGDSAARIPVLAVAGVALGGMALGGMALGALLLLRRRRSVRIASRVEPRPRASAAADSADARCDSTALPNELTLAQPIRPLLRRSRAERRRECELARGDRGLRQRWRSVSKRRP